MSSQRAKAGVKNHVWWLVYLIELPCPVPIEPWSFLISGDKDQ